MGTLALLTGGSNKRYQGQIRSRAFAQEVERRVHLQQLFGLPNSDAAVDMLMRGLKVDDLMTDGLMYITITLKGPSRMGPDPRHLRTRVKEAAAQAANEYYMAFRHYLATADTDKEAILLRNAEDQVKEARQIYEQNAARVTGLFRKGADPGAIMIGTGGGSDRGSSTSSSSQSDSDQKGDSDQKSDVSAGGSDIQRLYIKRAELEIEMNSADEGRSEINRLLNLPMDQLLKLPPEDPLLAGARYMVNSAERRYRNYQIQFGEENPRVVDAKAKLEQERTLLQDQKNAILNGRTTSLVRRKQLTVEYATVLQQIAKAERRFRTGRQSALRFEKLRTEMSISLEALKTTSIEYAKLKMQVPAGQNRIQVIDAAIPPPFGTPGMLVQALTSLVIAVAGTSILVGYEYIQRSLYKGRTLLGS